MCLSQGEEELMATNDEKLRFCCQTGGFKRMSVQHERKVSSYPFSLHPYRYATENLASCHCY